MKRLLSISLVLSGCLGFASCNLDLEPKSSVTFENFFRNEEDLYSVVAEIHGTLRETMTSVSYQDHMGARIDWINSSAASYERLRNNDPNTLALPHTQQQWKRYYNVLTQADLFMDNYHRAKDVVPSHLDFCIGQCYFARAVCYLWLGRTWGDAVITKGSNYSDKYAKSPADVVIDTAIYYGLKAYDILPKHSEMRGWKDKVLTSKQYGCKGSAAAVLAHLYAWKGSIFNDQKAIEEAEKWATKLIDPQYADEIGTYVLAADPEAVCERTLVRNDAESIFEINVDYFESDYGQFLIATDLVNYPVKRNSTLQDAVKVRYGVSLSTVREMYGENDKRRSAYFYRPDDPEVSNSASLAYLYKWRKTLYRESASGGAAMFRNLDCNKVIFRLADIILLRAECRAKLGNTGGAAEDLNTIRSRAGADLFPAEGESMGDLQLLVFREREKELLFEGQRYYDIRRNGTEYVRRELSEGFRVLTDGEIANGALYLPVPEPAFRDNDLMIQNTYWMSKMK